MDSKRKRSEPVKVVKEQRLRTRETEQSKPEVKNTDRAKTEIKLDIIKPQIILPSFIIDESDSKPKKITTDKYLRLAEDADIEEKKQFAERVNKGELTRAHYAIDNDKGYHYFLIVKK